MTANPLPPIPPISATTGMVPAHGVGRFKPVDPIKVLRQHAVWLVAAGVLGIVLGVAAWFGLNQVSPQWTSQAQIRVTPPNRDADTIGREFGGSRDALEAYMQTEAVRISSEQILRVAIDNPVVRNTAWYASHRSPQEAVESLQKDDLSVYPVRNSQLITLAVNTREMDDAPRILDAILEVYLRTVREEVARSAGGDINTLSNERSRTEDEYRQLEQQLRDFTLQQDLNTLDDRADEASIAYQELSKQKVTLDLALDQSKGILSGLEERVNSGVVESTPEVMQQIELDPEVLQLSQTINTLRLDVEANTAAYGENHRSTQYLVARMKKAETDKAAMIDRKLRERQVADLERARMTVTQLQGQIDAMNPKMAESSARMTDLTNKLQQHQLLLERVQSTRARLDDLISKIADWRRIAGMEGFVPVQRHVNPTLPEKTFPRLSVVVPLATFLLVGLTAGAIFLRELLDQRIKSPADVKLLPEVDLLGVLPDASEDPSNPTGIERVVERYPTGLMAEQFRQVRTAILAKMDRRGYKTLMVVGGQPGSGASTIAENLAASLAFNGRDVLIVDANFRRPSQHRLVGAANEVGLVDVLHGKARVEDAVIRLEGISVSIMPTGKGAEAAPELLECSACRSMLAALESQYDVVIIDAPPALLTSEPQLLAKHVDALAIVVRAVKDHRGMVERMLKRLDGQRADVLGVILNGVRSSAGGYFRQSYRDFYSYREEGQGLRETRAERLLPGPATAGAAGRNGNGRHDDAEHD